MEKSLCPASEPEVRTPPGQKLPTASSDKGPSFREKDPEQPAKKAAKKRGTTSPIPELAKKRCFDSGQTLPLSTAPANRPGPSGTYGTKKPRAPKQSSSATGVKEKVKPYATAPATASKPAIGTEHPSANAATYCWQICNEDENEQRAIDQLWAPGLLFLPRCRVRPGRRAALDPTEDFRRNKSIPDCSVVDSGTPPWREAEAESTGKRPSSIPQCEDAKCMDVIGAMHKLPVS
ncbi:hypothetical protein UY3_06890 [Chelonia mydas]|uniref:Uncharacterized protein n=1 Tax=Chelonia mydas TaxID=8469 RepID=M7BFF0_CHEMY|nr:hypothetical protein UY3_06890 [Chelonia mydas]